MSVVGGVVLDSTALLAFVSGRPYAAAVVWHAVEQGVVLVVPAASLVDAQARLAPADLEVIEALVDLPVTVVVDLTRGEARQVAAVLAKVRVRWEPPTRGVHGIQDSAERGGRSLRPVAVAGQRWFGSALKPAQRPWHTVFSRSFL